jgi:hypothetical protein
MTEGEVAALARGLGAVEKSVENLTKHVEGLRINVKENREATIKEIGCLRNDIRGLKIRLAQDEAWKGAIARGISHPLTLALVSGVAVGLGFGGFLEAFKW